MKELTTEEKARSYDKAIGKAAALYKASEPMSGCNVIIETLFPELAESKDEKIRKELLDFCKNRAEKYPNDPKYKNISAWLAWLEKQKGNIGGISTNWSEEDEKMIESLIESLTRISANTRTDSTSPNFSFYKEIDWLKSLKDRVQPQPKQEWSEDDKDYYDAIIAKLEVTQEDAALTDNQMDFLKSLRPQNRWKPSETDIMILEKVFNEKIDPKDFQVTLFNVLEQLKKL